MRYFIRILSIFCSALCVIIFSLIYLGCRFIPDNITIVENSRTVVPNFFGASMYGVKGVYETGVAEGTARTSQNETEVTLLKIIPVKNAKITGTKRQYVTIGGDIFGIKLYTNGVIVVSTDTIETDEGSVNPAKEADLRIGDIIISVNGTDIQSVKHLSSIIQESNGEYVNMTVLRSGIEKKISFRTVKEKISNKYRAGLWVRDSTAGIGTVTFYKTDNNSFAGLGHAICDTDTDKIMPMKSGEMAEAYVNGFYKSSNGSVGELCGVFTGKNTGVLCVNDETGIYGYTTKTINGKMYPVAVKQEVHEGEAQIFCTIDNSEPKLYNVKIVKVNSNSASVNKDMVIEITDEELLSKTGGILQGMSGTPIIQDGMLVGAVTHVFVNNTKQGYAIFAERMLETSVCQDMKKYEQFLQNAA